jgi:5-hydroxyisourate hydrolase-like protein (transthyretin family)
MRILVLLAFFAIPGWTCSCAVSQLGNPACQAAWKHDAVFTGTVEDISDPPLPTVVTGPAAPPNFPQWKVRFRIAEALRGIEPKQPEIIVETGLGGGDCGYSFQRGLTYIVYASKKPGGGFSTGICTPTRLAEDAADDLKYFHGLAQAPPTAEIRVQVFDVYGKRQAQELAALPGAAITIDGPGGQRTAAADTSGRHVFAGLPDGEYKIAGSLEGYTTGYPLQAVQLHSKGCAEVALGLQLDRTVSGHILTIEGLPAPGVLVEAVPVRPRHENDLPFAADSATTDATGRYELRHLPAGDYYVGISLSHTPNFQQLYTRWFYPGTEDPLAAVPLHVADQPGAQRFDLTLPPAQHVRVIRGTVYSPDARPAEGVEILLEDLRWSWQTSTVNAMTDKDGRFSLHVLDGTTYRLHAVKAGRDGVSAVPVQIDPGNSPLDLQLVINQKGYSVRELMRKGLEDWRKGLGIR